MLIGKRVAPKTIRKAPPSTILIRGDRLTHKQKEIVLCAFIYRWTADNGARETVWQGIQGKPTIELISDEQWIKEHAFYFHKSGERLSNKKTEVWAVPAYMTEV